jgi:hypothetical protein
MLKNEHMRVKGHKYTTFNAYHVTKHSLDPRPIIIHYKHLTIKNNPYNSKPIPVFPHEMVYYVIRCNLVLTIFYMHNFIITLSCP